MDFCILLDYNMYFFKTKCFKKYIVHIRNILNLNIFLMIFNVHLFLYIYISCQMTNNYIYTNYIISLFV